MDYQKTFPPLERENYTMATQGKMLNFKREGKKSTTYAYSIEAGLDPITGKRKRTSKSGFKTAKEARAAAQPILNKLLLGQNIIESNITFSEYANTWLNNKRIGIKLATQSNIETTISIANKYFRNKKIKDITPYIYQQFINDYSTNIKIDTVKMRHKIINNIFKAAVKFNIIRTNPTIDVEFPNKTTPKKDITDLYLTKEELQKFLLFLKNKKYKSSRYFYPLCVLLAYTGMRLGEACALTWQDIDFNKKTIFIHSSMFAKNYTIYQRQDTPKNQSSIRKIFIDKFLIKILKDWHKEQLINRLNNGINNKVDAEDYVFTNIVLHTNKEKAVLPIAVSTAFKYINKKHLFPKHIHAHMLRHTHVSLLAETRKVSLTDIQARLGHSSDETTRRVYLHVTEKSKIDTARIFEEYMAK